MRRAPFLLVLLALLALAACVHAPTRESLAALPKATTEKQAFHRFRGRGGDTAVRVLSDNAEAWATRWQMIADADRRIDASTYILDRDVFGLAYLGALYERQREGVEVHLRVDARGGGALAAPVLASPDLQDLVAAGADVRIFNPPLSQLAMTLLSGDAVPVSAGAHEKILVIDRRFAITGGRNIAAPYFTTPAENADAVIDGDILVRGGAVAEVLADVVARAPADEVIKPEMFDIESRTELLLIIYGAMDAWLHGTVPSTGPDVASALEAAGLNRLMRLPLRGVRDEARPLLSALARYRSIYGTLPLAAESLDPARARVTVSESGVVAQRKDPASEALLLAIAGAQKRILLQSPYLLLTRRTIAALVQASHRGVEITVVTNSADSSDNEASQALFIDSWPELEARIPTMRIFVAADRQMQHVKRAVFDDELTLIGSYNLDPLSAHLNSEVLLGVWSRAVNAESARAIEARVTGGDVLEYRILRGHSGDALRYPPGGPRAGQVAVAFGPRNHLPQARIEQLEQLKQFLFSIRGIWDFEFVVW